MIKLPPSMRVFERGWLSSNNVLFIGEEGSAIVDTGYLTHAEQTLALVSHELSGRPLDLIVNTHLHSDHCGGNAILQKAYRSRTLIPAAEADKVRNWDMDALSFKATGQQCERFGFDGTLAPGDELELGGMSWQALAAPGHDPHSLILYCPEHGILISADALWENGFGVIFPELDGESGFAEQRATLDLIAGLDVKLVIPGHGAPFTDAQKALAIAYSRVDYLAADPARNAQNAVKVMLKFLLLERCKIALAELPDLLDAGSSFRSANLHFLKQSPVDLAQWATAQLVRAQAARVDGEFLLNSD
ncbi:MAG: MBL fold metallo-hydrolase [Burkholderiaceae bacterium]|nr:MBL fold metallo-hydrolase [Burkholderiaceae bacterium]